MSSLKSSIEKLSAQGEVAHDPEARKIFLEFRDQLTQGKIRAAEKVDGQWTVNAWVKQGILLGFRLGALADMTAGLSFVDKDTFPARQFTVTDRVRVVPGGSSVRARSLHRAIRNLHAAHVHQRRSLRRRRHDGRFPRPRRFMRADRQARPPQRRRAGRRSPRAHQRRPVIIEDDVLVGGNCGIFEGTLVRARAVLGAGTILTRSTPLYDLVKGEVYRATARGAARSSRKRGSRSRLARREKRRAAEWNLSLYTPVIVKYRDEKTDRGIELEDWLR